jgi:hypothetical protein
MSDLERQEISISVDSVEVEDAMAMGAKKQGDANKMEIDPLNWTVDHVVDFLCHSTSMPWSSDSSPRPDPVFFEAALRKNLVNGKVLLNDVDKDILREDLGLEAYGHRSTVLDAIRYLQKLSGKYQTANSTTNIQGKLLLSFIPYSKL